MTRHVGRLRADTRTRIARDIAAQVAARHGLSVRRRNGLLLAEGVSVILLAVRRLRAIVCVSGGGQRQRNDNAACDEQ
ncbi:hypothetical protein J4G50_09665 [Burkholderia anthina]|uniref:Uncharacterized protein n=1 Tax=Burkholderia anthina TaxID=179879 RepID=A0ABS2B791_9BURK|nr:hypothetical protein [Burkholderia anthina]QTD88113.1 hypothetical protein J4G50_09665 [Burkholderia anthina]